MFSVVIPLYNKAPYVTKAVQSVLAQTVRDVEVLIVNDGSTDISIDKIGEFTDNRLRIIHQANAGVSAARNTGVQQARFDYVAFLDADDWWDEHFLEDMQTLIGQFPEAGLYGSSYYVVKNHGYTPAQIGVTHDFSAGYIDYFGVYARTFWVPINCSFVVVKKSVFIEENGFRVALKFGEDLDLWIRIALKHKVGYVNKLLAYSNQDAETANRALGEIRFWRKSEHVIFNLDYLAEHERSNPGLKQLLDGLRVRSLTDYYLNGWYPEDVQVVLSRVNFAVQPPLYRFIYQWPRGFVSAWFRTKRLGSVIKQAVIREYLSRRTHQLT